MQKALSGAHALILMAEALRLAVVSAGVHYRALFAWLLTTVRRMSTDEANTQKHHFQTDAQALSEFIHGQLFQDAIGPQLTPVRCLLAAHSALCVHLTSVSLYQSCKICQKARGMIRLAKPGLGLLRVLKGDTSGPLLRLQLLHPALWSLWVLHSCQLRLLPVLWLFAFINTYAVVKAAHRRKHCRCRRQQRHSWRPRPECRAC